MQKEYLHHGLQVWVISCLTADMKLKPNTIGSLLLNLTECSYPRNKEVHGLIHDEKYNKGDMSLNLAINEKYFNEGYDEVEGPVTVDITSTDNDWDITLEERPDWSREQGYPEENNTENQQEPEQIILERHTASRQLDSRRRRRCR